MKCLIIMAILISLVASPAIAQVEDTLQLTQVSSITASEGIWNCLSANFWNDNTSELVLCGSSHIFIYDGLTQALLWTSPMLATSGVVNGLIEFLDMNNDGYVDLAIADTICVQIFDIVHDQRIWSSDTIVPNSYSFGLGDRNSDGFPDVIIQKRGPTDYDNNPDSAWIEAFDGPDFHFTQRIYFPLDAYHHSYPDYENMVETPGRIVITQLSGNQGLQNALVIFTPKRRWSIYYDGVYINQTEIKDGGIRILNPISFGSIANIGNAGSLQSYSIRQLQNQEIYIFSSLQYYSHYSNDHGEYANHIKNYIDCISANGLVNSRCRTIGDYWSNQPGTQYTGPLIGDIMPDLPGDELCYGYLDSLRLISYPDFTPIWVAENSGIASNKLNLYNSPSLFIDPQILAYSSLSHFTMRAFDGNNGNYTAIFQLDSIQPNLIVDLNSDGEDEIIKYKASRSDIRIYHAAFNDVGINKDKTTLPSTFSLHANYPNPFNAQTIISYDLPKEANVKLEVYDLLGRKVATLTEGMQEAGTHQADWDGSGVSSGLYFYRLKTGDYSDIKKMTLLK
jgi:hypothetical protein